MSLRQSVVDPSKRKLVLFMNEASPSVTSYKLDDRGWIPDRKNYFSLRHHCAQTDSGAHPSYEATGTEESASGGKAVGARSKPLTTSADLKNAWSFTFSPCQMPSWRCTYTQEQVYLHCSDS